MKHIARKICFRKPNIPLISECLNNRIDYKLIEANSLLNSNTTNVLIRCKQAIVIEKYIAHHHFEVYCRKICFRKPINLFTSECIDIEMNYILIKANSLLNSNTTNVLICCIQRTVIEKYIAHNHFEVYCLKILLP